MSYEVLTDELENKNNSSFKNDASDLYPNPWKGDKDIDESEEYKASDTKY